MTAIAFRPAADTDMAAIYDTWLSSFRASPDAGQVPMDLYEHWYGQVIDRLLKRAGVSLIVGYHPHADPGVADLYGWVCTERGVTLKSRVWHGDRYTYVLEKSPLPVIHYCYVFRDYRKKGIARRLCEEAGASLSEPFLYTFCTPTISRRRILLGTRDHMVARFPKERQ